MKFGVRHKGTPIKRTAIRLTKLQACLPLENLRFFL